MGSGQHPGPRRLLSPLRWPWALLPAPSFPGLGTVLSWALGGSRARGLPRLCPQLGAAPCQEQACAGACSDCELLSGDLPSKQARPNKVGGMEASLTLSVLAFWEQNKRGLEPAAQMCIYTRTQWAVGSPALNGSKPGPCCCPVLPARERLSQQHRPPRPRRSRQRAEHCLRFLSPALAPLQPAGLRANGREFRNAPASEQPHAARAGLCCPRAW